MSISGIGSRSALGVQTLLDMAPLAAMSFTPPFCAAQMIMVC